MKSKDIVGLCGLYCEICTMHRAYEDKDLSPMKEAPVNFVKALELPAELSFKDVACEGCLSSTVFSFCEKCDIRKCVMDKNKQWCFECDESPCEKLFKFQSEWQLPILDNLREIKRMGAAKWLEKMDKEHRCQQCGRKLHWYSYGICPTCSKKS